jgi:hypothetical protein
MGLFLHGFLIGVLGAALGALLYRWRHARRCPTPLCRALVYSWHNYCPQCGYRQVSR